MLTLTKYAFIVLAIVLAILAINFGRAKYILTGNQSVSLAFYRYTIAQSDITAEFPSNVLARITPTSAETTMMQNTGLIMQYKIDYTDTNVADVGWTAYDSNNQPAILDDCTIYCRYYGAAQTSGGVEFTGPETTKQVKVPKIRTLDGTTVILTKAGTADATDAYVKASDYYGEAIDYQGNTSDTKTYRLFYVDFDNKYKDGEGTIYLKADWTANDTSLESYATYNPQDDKDATIIANMNAQWGDEVDNNSDGKINSNEITNVNEHAAAWLASPSQWTDYANGSANKTGNTEYTYVPNGASSGYEMNYAIGSPSVEMYIDSYNESFNGNYKTQYATKGYQYSINNGATFVNQTNGNTIGTEKNGLYSYSSQGEVWWWLSSPNEGNQNYMCGVTAMGMGLTYYGTGNIRSVCPVISIKPTTINSVGNYVEVNSSNQIIKGYTTLASAMSGATSGNTIAVLNDTTETTAPTIAATNTDANSSPRVLTLDLNGKTITLNEVTLTNDGTLTITGSGTLITADDRIVITNRGTLNLEGTATISNTIVSNANTAYVINNGATGYVNINGGNITGECGIYCNETGSVEIISGSINTSSHCIHSLSGDVIISGGTLTTDTGDAVWMSSSGTIQILGGTVTGYTDGIIGFSSDSSTENSLITVTGGTIICNNGPGIYTKGNLTVGTNDGNVSKTIPSITGKTSGVSLSNNSTLNFYDGVITGKYGNGSAIRGTTIPASGYGVHIARGTDNGVAIETATLERKYTVTANANGGTIPATAGWTVASGSVTATKDVTFDQAYGTLPTPTKTGYTFKGWRNTNGKNLMGEVTYNASSGWCMYSDWDGNKLTLNTASLGVNTAGQAIRVSKFNGNTYISDICRISSAGYCTCTFQKDANVNNLDITLNGNHQDAGAFIDVSQLTNGETYTISFNIDVYNTFYVEISKIQIETGSSATTYEPYCITDSTIVTVPNPHTITAKWELTNYTISYNLNGGSVAPANPTAYNINSSDITLNAPTKTGYTFAGWTDTQDSVGKAETGEYVRFENGQWIMTNWKNGNTLNQFKIQVCKTITPFNFLGGIDYSQTNKSGTWTNTYDSGTYYIRFGANGTSADITSNFPVYLEKGATYHYGWTMDSFSTSEIRVSNFQFYKVGGSVVTIPNDYIPTGSTGDRTLTANWTANTYTVAFNPTDGSVSTTTKNVTYDSQYGTLPTPTRTGYIFTGWYNTTEPISYYTGQISTDNNSSNLSILTKVSPGITYNITIESIIKNAGNANYFTTLIYDFTTGQIVTSTSQAFGTNLSYSITCPSSVSASDNVRMLIYHGPAGQTGGMNVTASNVRVGIDSTTSSVQYKSNSTVSTAYNHSLFAHWVPDQVTSGAQTLLQATNNNGGSHSSTTTTWKAITGADGTITGTTTWGDNYLQFDGSSTYVNLGYMNTDYQTIEATISVGEESNYTEFFGNWESGGGGFAIGTDHKIGGTLYINGNYRIVSSVSTISPGQKYHIAMSYDGNTMKLYINGNLETTLSDANIQNKKISYYTGYDTIMAIGGNPGGSTCSNPTFNGKIYTAAVYNRALTAAEIQQNATAGLAIAESSSN